MKYSLVASLILQSTIVLGELLPVQLKAPTHVHFADIVRNDTYDLGCRPIAHRTEDGQFELTAWLTEDQIAHLDGEYAAVPEVSINRMLVKRQSGKAPIGTGDRFSGGSVAPRGLGVQSSSTTFSSILNINEIDSAIKGLVTKYGISTITLPNKTFQGRTQTAAYVGAGTDKSKYYLYLSAGIHARERGGPDNLLYWIADLLEAKATGSGLKYGSKSYTNAQVNTVLSAGIVFFPAVNPDGIAYDQANGNLWRKNRNTRSGTSGSSVGVDLNRNFDFLWDYPKYFDPNEQPASTNPSSEVYKGTAAVSEPETKNHVSLYSTFPKIRWFMDIHSAVGDILYSWGDDQNQGTNTAMNFRNAQYDGVRGTIGDSEYREYISSTDASNSQRVATACANGMAAVGGRRYSTMQAAALYPTSGASDDYAFSRTFANSANNKVYGYTMEFGKSSGNFYPTVTEYNQNILDTNAGFMEWALTAISVGLV